MQVRSLGWEDPLEEEMATHSSILFWKLSWMEEPGTLCSPWGHKELDTTKQLSTGFSVLYYLSTLKLMSTELVIPSNHLIIRHINSVIYFRCNSKIFRALKKIRRIKPLLPLVQKDWLMIHKNQSPLFSRLHFYSKLYFQV